jgi:hypothetical protein
MTTPTRPTNYELALKALAKDGLSVEDARKVFVADPQSVERLAAVGLEMWADEEVDRAEAEFRNSDEGKRLAAQQVIAQEADVKARREEAKALVRATGAPEVELTDTELTSLTGIDIPTVEPVALRENTQTYAEELAENIAAANRGSAEGDA